MNKAIKIIQLLIGVIWLVLVIALITRVMPDQVRLAAGYFLAINVIGYMAWMGYQSLKRRKQK